MHINIIPKYLPKCRRMVESWKGAGAPQFIRGRYIVGDIHLGALGTLARDAFAPFQVYPANPERAGAFGPAKAPSTDR